jgi:hypothetical protein
MGDTPFYLILQFEDENVGIDLDEYQWYAKNEQYMRKPGRWLLVHKASQHPILVMQVRDGEQPYYVARHVGIVGSGGSNEVTAYGIGKKRVDGHTDRLWAMPNGTVCGGDDVESIGIGLLHELGPRI